MVVCGVVAVTAGWAWWTERGRRRILEARLSSTEARAELAEAVFNACPESVLIMDPNDQDEALAIVACNDRTCELHQWSREELVGKSVNQIEARADHWPDHASVMGLIAEVRRSKIKRGEAIHRRRDGVLFPVEYSNSLVTIGGREFMLGFDRDITARKRAEQELRESEERFRLIIEASPVPIQLLDPHDPDVPMRIVTANRRAAEMHGVTLNEFVGRSIGDFEPERISIEAAQAKAASLRTCSHVEGEGVHRHVDGHEFPIEYTCALITIGGRELIVGCDHDIGERKRLDAEVAEGRRLRAVGAMVGGVAHEFNNLLTPVLLHLERSHDPEARTVLKAVEQARELTQRIMTFGRKPEDSAEVCDATAVVRECVDLLSKTIDRRIEIVIEKHGGRFVRVARNDLSQIVINLLLNARDTLVEKLETVQPAGWRPEIRLSVGAATWERNGTKGERVLVRVGDNGMGLSAEVKERIFEPFFTTKPPGKGTGLGLATVWHLVLAAGGHVAIQSEEGRGSAVEVYLPVGEATPAAPSAVQKPVEAPAEEARPAGRVLLVEDNELVSMSVIQMLRVGGYEVTHFENGAEACAAVTGELGRWDRVLTDLNLPGMHGTELVSRIRKEGYVGKVVVYSGMIGADDAEKVTRAGVAAVLQKPFAMKTLWEALR